MCFSVFDPLFQMHLTNEMVSIRGLPLADEVCLGEKAYERAARYSVIAGEQSKDDRAILGLFYRWQGQFDEFSVDHISFKVNFMV